MEYYKSIIKDIFDDLIRCGDESKEEILKRWENGETEDDFGNLSGSRTFSTAEAERCLADAGYPFNDELNDLLSEYGYDLSISSKGAETVDVILCEIIMWTMLDELRNYEPIWKAKFDNGKDSFIEYFEAETKEEARSQAELYLSDEASDFADKKGYKLLSIE